MILKERILVALKEIAIRRPGKTNHSSTWIGGFFILATTVWLSTNIIPQAVKQIQSSHVGGGPAFLKDAPIPGYSFNFVTFILMDVSVGSIGEKHWKFHFSPQIVHAAKPILGLKMIILLVNCYNAQKS